ncbi:MAG: hypothetical protein ACRDI2_25505 [Chloroflexota bacterium]
METQYPYPHLAPELRRLWGDALTLWADAAERAGALAAMLAAWDSTNDAALRQRVRRVDDAVRAGLAALDLPRDPAADVRLVSRGRTWIGRVEPDGTILIEVERVRYCLGLGMVDRIFHAWVHESIHARRLASSGRSAESAAWAGYEEGMAEGLARIVTDTKAHLAVHDRSYE